MSFFASKFFSSSTSTSSSTTLATSTPPTQKNTHLGRRVHRVAVDVREVDLVHRLLGHRASSLLDEPVAAVVVHRVRGQRERADAHLSRRRDLRQRGRLAVPVPQRLGRVQEEEVVSGRVVLVERGWLVWGRLRGRNTKGEKTRVSFCFFEVFRRPQTGEKKEEAETNSLRRRWPVRRR